MAEILRGAEVVEALSRRIASEVELLVRQGVVPALALVRVGERGDDLSYERAVTQYAEGLGVAVRSIVLPEDTTTGLLINTLESLNADADVHGVLLFRPLPGHIDEDLVRNTLLPTKDIDGMTDLSLAGVFTGMPTGFPPCTAQACREILQHFAVELKGKKAVVIGRSLVVGKPVALLLLAEHATVTIAHSRTEDLPGIVKEADIVVACAGQARMIDAGYLRPGQVVIDVGINVTDAGELVGDVDFEEAATVVEALTPVPGGVGIVTTGVLVKHVVMAASKTTSQPNRAHNVQ